MGKNNGVIIANFHIRNITFSSIEKEWCCLQEIPLAHHHPKHKKVILAYWGDSVFWDNV